MKKKISKILGVVLSVTLLASLVLAAVPVLADVSEPKVTLIPNTISNAGKYLIKFDSNWPLDDGAVITKIAAATLVVGAGDVVRFVAGDTITFTAGDTISYNGAATAAIAAAGTQVVAALGIVQFTAGDTITFAAGDTVQVFGNPYTETIAAAGTLEVTADTLVTFTAGDTITFTAGDTISYNGAATAAIAAAGTQVVAALGQVWFTAGDTLTFTAGDAITYRVEDNAATITIRFSSTTVTPDGILDVANVKVKCDPETGAAPALTNVARAVGDSSLDTITVVMPAGQHSNALSHIQVEIGVGAAVKNPHTAGSYILEVKTSQETTYVDSDDFTVGVAVKADVYNDKGNYIAGYSGSTTALGLAIAACPKSGTIKLSEGTYDQNVNFNVADKVTLEAVGTAANTVVDSNITITNDEITIEGITIKGEMTVAATADKATIQDCILVKEDKAVETLITVAAAATNLKVTDCSIDTTYKDYADVGIAIGAATATISGCSFELDADLGATDDIAISVTGAAPALEVKDSTFTGASGYGFKDTGGGLINVIKDNTFEGLEKGIWISSATSANTIQTNTITDCSKSTAAAIDIDAAGTTLIEGNSVTDNLGYSIDIAGNAGSLTVQGNNFTGNAKGMRNSTTTSLDAELNWWGAISGPTHIDNPGGTGETVTDYIDYKPWIEGATTKSETATIVAGGTFDASNTVGIVYSSTLATANITLTKYDANPAPSAPKYTAVSDGYYDVYVPAATGVNTIKFYNDNITADTDAYVWSPREDKWVECSIQGVAGTLEFVWIQVTAASTPSIVDLSGTVFGLVAAPAEADLDDTVILAPEWGAIDQPIQPAFQWAEVDDAVSYEFQIADNYAFQTVVEGKMTDGGFINRTGLTTTVFGVDVDLDYATTYYWRVRATTTVAVRPTDVGDFGDWSVGVFTTVEAPVEPTPPVVIEPAPPAPIVELPEAETPPYIWAIIGIGAVLVIAVIVLIVRTRRVA